MTLEQFAGELEYIGDLYPHFTLSERMTAEWFTRLEKYEVTALHEAIGEWLESSNQEAPTIKELVRLTDVATHARQRQQAAHARRQWEKEQESIPVEERAEDLTLGVRQLLVTRWPEYRHLWPDVAAVEAEA